MLSEGCHSFDLSFLFFPNPPTFFLVTLERGVRGIEPGLDFHIFLLGFLQIFEFHRYVIVVSLELWRGLPFFAIHS